MRTSHLIMLHLRSKILNSAVPYMKYVTVMQGKEKPQLIMMRSLQ